MNMNNSGMSLIMTMLLLIGTAVVIGAGYYTWSNSIYTDATEKITPTIKSSIGDVMNPLEISTMKTYYLTNLDLDDNYKISNNPDERFIQTIKLNFVNIIDEDLTIDTRIFCLTQNISWASVNIDETNNSLLLDRNGAPYNYNEEHVYFNGTAYNSSMKFYDENGKLYYAASSNGNAINTSNLNDLINLNCPTKSLSLKSDSKGSVNYYLLINSTKVPNTIVFKVVTSTKYGDIEKKITFEINR